jgi:hypothetical protein
MTQNATYEALVRDGIVAQGDIVVVWVDGTPPAEMQATPDQEDLIVAHSETGHHHVASPVSGFVPKEGLLAKMIGDKAKSDTHTFLRGADGERVTAVVNSVPVTITHKRNFFTHGTIEIPPVQKMGSVGYWEIIRQEVPVPGGGRALNQD